MTLEIAKQAREHAIASIERYCLENMDEKTSSLMPLRYPPRHPRQPAW